MFPDLHTLLLARFDGIIVDSYIPYILVQYGSTKLERFVSEHSHLTVSSQFSHSHLITLPGEVWFRSMGYGTRVSPSPNFRFTTLCDHGKVEACLLLYIKQ